MTNFISTFRCFKVVIVASFAAALSGQSLRAKDLADDSPANAASKAVSDETRRILNNIQDTEYRHTTDVDEANGIYRCDCSGLGIYILNRTVAKDDPEGPLDDGKVRPRAMDFHDVFAAAKGAEAGERWERVERLVDARPGDIIAWRRAVVVPGNSGHVVIVDATPTVDDDGLVRVVMIDSTTRPQTDDTRKAGESGVGRGTMWFQVDEAGRPFAHIRGTRDGEVTPAKISIGRAVPVDADAAAKRKAA